MWDITKSITVLGEGCRNPPCLVDLGPHVNGRLLNITFQVRDGREIEGQWIWKDVSSILNV